MMQVKMKKSVQIVAGLCVTLLGCCGLGLAQDVTYNFMPGTNFSQFHTFKWVTIPGGPHPNQITDQEIQNAVVSQFWATRKLWKSHERKGVAVTWPLSMPANGIRTTAEPARLAP